MGGEFSTWADCERITDKDNDILGHAGVFKSGGEVVPQLLDEISHAVACRLFSVLMCRSLPDVKSKSNNSSFLVKALHFSTMSTTVFHLPCNWKFNPFKWQNMSAKKAVCSLQLTKIFLRLESGVGRPLWKFYAQIHNEVWDWILCKQWPFHCK